MTQEQSNHYNDIQSQQDNINLAITYFCRAICHLRVAGVEADGDIGSTLTELLGKLYGMENDLRIENEMQYVRPIQINQQSQTDLYDEVVK